MADRKFEIEVATSFNPAGTQQAAEGLQNVGKATGQTAEKAEVLNKNSREMHRLFGEIDRIAPGMGESIKAAFEPQAAGILALIVLVELLTHQFEKWKQTQEQAAALSVDIWRAQAEGAASAAESARQYNEAIERVPGALDAINAKASANKAILDAQVAAHKAIIDSLEKEELAGAKGDADKEADIRRRYGAYARNGDIGAEQANLDSTRGELKQTISAAFAAQLLSAMAESAKQESLTKPANVVTAEQFMEDNRQRFAAANKYIEDNGGEQHALNTIDKVRAAHGGQNTVFSQDLQDIVTLIDKYKSAKETQSSFEASQKQAATTATETLSAFEALKKKIDELNAQITTGQAVLNIHRATAATQSAFDAVNRAGGNPNDIISSGAGALDAFEHGQKLSATQTDQLTVFRALFQTVGGNAVAVVQIAKQALAHGKSLEQEIAQLKQQYANLKSSQIKGSTTGQ